MRKRDGQRNMERALCLHPDYPTLTFTASRIIASPSSLAGTLYSPNASCGIDDPFGVIRVGSAMI